MTWQQRDRETDVSHLCPVFRYYLFGVVFKLEELVSKVFIFMRGNMT